MGLHCHNRALAENTLRYLLARNLFIAARDVGTEDLFRPCNYVGAAILADTISYSTRIDFFTHTPKSIVGRFDFLALLFLIVYAFHTVCKHMRIFSRGSLKLYFLFQFAPGSRIE